jgi:hypothetical protein
MNGISVCRELMHLEKACCSLEIYWIEFNKNGMKWCYILIFSKDLTSHLLFIILPFLYNCYVFHIMKFYSNLLYYESTVTEK